MEVGIHRLEFRGLAQLPQQFLPKPHQNSTALRHTIESTKELLPRRLGRANQGHQVLGTNRLGVTGSELPHGGRVWVELRCQGLKKLKLPLGRERLVLIECALGQTLANGLPGLSKETMAVLEQALELPLLVGLFFGLA